jgi:hypothetical protein
MVMHAELFTDGVDEVTVGGSVVRVDLVSLSPTERDNHNAPKLVFSQRLIFSLEAFANSVEVMQNALQGLIEAGAIKRKVAKTSNVAPAISPIGEHGSATNNAARSPNVSTNFR